MSALYKTSTLFVDFENILVKTDDFVCGKFYEMFKNDPDLTTNPLHSFFGIIKETGEDSISSFSETKKFMNPLYEVFDISVIPEDELKSLRDEYGDDYTIAYTICDDIYYSILNHEYKFDLINEFTYTNVADSIKLALKDSQLETVYVYVKTLTNCIHKSIYDQFMNSDKIKIVSGDKAKFLNETPCGTYIVQDITDLIYLPKTQTENKIDFTFLNIPYNDVVWNTEFRDEDGSHDTISLEYNANIHILESVI